MIRTRYSKMALADPPQADARNYDETLAAVMQTARGRWFLDEFARRNRYAETEELRRLLQKIHK